MMPLTGRSSDQVERGAMALKRSAYVIAVGIGRRVSRRELELIATDPENDVFLLENFDALADYNEDIGTAVCFGGRREGVREE